MPVVLSSTFSFDLVFHTCFTASFFWARACTPNYPSHHWQIFFFLPKGHLPKHESFELDTFKRRRGLHIWCLGNFSAQKPVLLDCRRNDVEKLECSVHSACIVAAFGSNQSLSTEKIQANLSSRIPWRCLYSFFMSFGLSPLALYVQGREGQAQQLCFFVQWWQTHQPNMRIFFKHLFFLVVINH